MNITFLVVFDLIVMHNLLSAYIQCIAVMLIMVLILRTVTDQHLRLTDRLELAIIRQNFFIETNLLTFLAIGIVIGVTGGSSMFRSEGSN